MMGRNTGPALLAIVAVILIILTGILHGCGRDYDGGDYCRMKKVEMYHDMNVYVDKDTGVAYAEMKGKQGAWFPLYDYNGDLYRPNGWRDEG